VSSLPIVQFSADAGGSRTAPTERSYEQLWRGDKRKRQLCASGVVLRWREVVDGAGRCCIGARWLTRAVREPPLRSVVTSSCAADTRERASYARAGLCCGGARWLTGRDCVLHWREVA